MHDTAIGGYFELELSYKAEYHKQAIKLNSGRHCLEYILRLRKYRKIWAPYYICEVVLEPIKKLELDYDFYAIDTNLEPLIDFNQIQSDEAIIYTNYFGIKDKYIANLVDQNNIIIDNSQAFFAPARDCFDTFYSPRKFIGVPDGGYLYTYNNDVLDINLPVSTSYDRFNHLLTRIDLGAEAGYADFKQNDSLISECELMKMSRLTERILASIDYEHVKRKRKEHFNNYHQHLKDTNLIKNAISDDFDGVALVYPYFTNNEGLREKLIKNKIFVAQYWPNVIEWCEEDSVESNLTRNMLALPIDQRLTFNDVDRIFQVLQNGV